MSSNTSGENNTADEALELYGDRHGHEHEEHDTGYNEAEEDGMEHHVETVFTVDSNGDEVGSGGGSEAAEHGAGYDAEGDANEDYGMDFNDYVDQSDDGDESEDAEDGGGGGDEDDEDDYDDEDGIDDEQLVVPDMGLTRESSLASRITNESGIFSHPRHPSVAYQPPTLESLSEEMKSNAAASDSEFINAMQFVKNAPQSSVSSTANSSRSSTISSGGAMADNHDRFVSNARYSHSIMSYDTDGADDNDDAFSFQANDDRAYEIGYVPQSRTSDTETETNVTDVESVVTADAHTIAENNDTDDYSSYRRSERNYSDDEDDDGGQLDSRNASARVKSDPLPAIPAMPEIPHAAALLVNTAPDSKGSMPGASSMAADVDNMRNAFVRSDIHPTLVSRASSDTSFGQLTDDPAKSIGTDMTNLQAGGKPGADEGGVAKDAEVNIEESAEKGPNTGLESKHGDEKEKASTAPTFKLGEVKSTELQVDVVAVLTKPGSGDSKIEKLRAVRRELSMVDTGLGPWISYNMGDSMKISMDDERIGSHVREAFAHCERVSTGGETLGGESGLGMGKIGAENGIGLGLGALSETMSETMESVAHGLAFAKRKGKGKIGERGRTLLRRLRKDPKQ